MLRDVRLALLILALLTPQAECAFWDVEIVYDGGFGSGDCSLAVSPAGVPTISYSADKLYLARRTAEEWLSEEVAAVGFMGGWSSHAYNSAGQPCIAYVDASGQVSDYVKFAYKSAGIWRFETVGTTGWAPDHVALAFAPSGQAYIAYCRTTGTYPQLQHRVWLARRVGVNNWVSEEIAQVSCVTSSVLGINSDNTIYVAFCDSGALKLATRPSGGAWKIDTIDGNPSEPVVPYISMTLQHNGFPAFAYVINSTAATQLKYARYSAGVWQKENAATLSLAGAYHCALCLSPRGMPFIAYHDPATETLMNAWKSGGSWFVETMDEAPMSGLRPCVKLDSLGNIDACWFDRFNSFVKFGWCLMPISVQEAKEAEDGATVQLSGLIASSASGEIEHRIYVQTQDRTCGLLLYYPTDGPVVERGDVIDAQGTLTTVDGEKAVEMAFAESLGDSGEPKPLGMTNAALGGGDFHYLPGPPARGQKGVTGGVGVNNIGLLARTAGKFLYDGPHEFRVDDGSGVLVRCVTPPNVTVDPSWQWVIVTGASSCRYEGANLFRVMRVRSAEDIVPVF